MKLSFLFLEGSHADEELAHFKAVYYQHTLNTTHSNFQLHCMQAVRLHTNPSPFPFKETQNPMDFLQLKLQAAFFTLAHVSLLTHIKIWKLENMHFKAV